MSELQGKRVLVVGGSSGLGLAAAQAAARLGAAVVVASRSQDKLQAAVAAIGAGSEGRVLDTTSDDSVEAFFRDDAAYDHVVVSAAQTKVAAVRDLPLADAFASMNSKFWGAYRVARAARIQDGGSLTFVTGVLAIRPRKGAAIQGAINAGLEALAQGLALELAPVRVNAVSPGLVETPLYAGLTEEARQAMYERAATTLPVGRVGQPEHIATQILALITNPYATGSVVYIHGGSALV
jgi:NAD(P)-dependent dehydrogenase (short-subunit alcohol dehydrogenase family)